MLQFEAAVFPTAGKLDTPPRSRDQAVADRLARLEREENVRAIHRATYPELYNGKA